MKINVLALGFAGVVVRFYLVMAIVIAAGFTGQWWLALFALPVFISALLGMAIQQDKAVATVRRVPSTQGKAA